MSYQELCYLKFRMGISTQELLRRYPQSRNAVKDVALMELPETVLKKIISEREDLKRLLDLKRQFKEFLDG